MITQSPWQAFESLQRLADYKPSEIEAFADRLFDNEDEETILRDFCTLNDYAAIIETIIKHIRPTVTQIVPESAQVL